MRLDETAHAKAKVIARREDRALNGQLEYWIKKSIERYELDNGLVTIEDEA